jgi:hypothetical protein
MTKSVYPVRDQLAKELKNVAVPPRVKEYAVNGYIGEYEHRTADVEDLGVTLEQAKDVVLDFLLGIGDDIEQEMKLYRGVQNRIDAYTFYEYCKTHPEKYKTFRLSADEVYDLLTDFTCYCEDEDKLDRCNENSEFHRRLQEAE